MSLDSHQIITEESMLVLGELECVLKKLLDFVRQGDSASGQFDTLIFSVDSLVRRIESLSAMKSAVLQDRCSQLWRLYRALCLGIAAEKADVCEELVRIRRGRKTITVYQKAAESYDSIAPTSYKHT